MGSGCVKAKKYLYENSNEKQIHRPQAAGHSQELQDKLAEVERIQISEEPRSSNQSQNP